MIKNILSKFKTPQQVDPSKYVGAIQSQLDKGDKDLKQRQQRFENFQEFVKESVDWFKEIQDRRFKGETLTPLEKNMVMKYETMASQYITDMYKLFNLVTKTKNYHGTIPQTSIQPTEKKKRQKRS